MKDKMVQAMSGSGVGLGLNPLFVTLLGHIIYFLDKWQFCEAKQALCQIKQMIVLPDKIMHYLVIC